MRGEERLSIRRWAQLALCAAVVTYGIVGFPTPNDPHQRQAAAIDLSDENGCFIVCPGGSTTITYSDGSTGTITHDAETGEVTTEGIKSGPGNQVTQVAQQNPETQETTTHEYSYDSNGKYSGSTTTTTSREQTPEEKKQNSWASSSHNRLEGDYGVTTPNSGEDTSAATLDKLLEDLPNTRGFSTDRAQTALEEIKRNLRAGQTYLSRDQMAKVLCAGMSGCTATTPTAIKRHLEQHGVTFGRGEKAGCTDPLGSGSCYDGPSTLSNDQTVTFLDRALKHQPGYNPPVTVYSPPSGPGPGPSCQNGFTVIAEHIDSANGDDGCRPPNCPFGRRSDGWCEIPASDDPPVVYVASTGPVAEDDGSASFSVVLSHPYTADVAVDASTSDGTATAGSDYIAVTAQTVTVAAGKRSVSVPVTIIDDTDEEPDETFMLSLSNPTNSATLSPSPQAEATITANDQPRRVQNLQASCERQRGSRFYEMDLSWEEPPGHDDIYQYRVSVIENAITRVSYYTSRTTHSATPELRTSTQNYRLEVTPVTRSKTVDGDPASVELYCGAPQTITFDRPAVTVAEGSSVNLTITVDPSYRWLEIPLVSEPQGATVRSDYSFPTTACPSGSERRCTTSELWHGKAVTFTARQDTDADNEEVVISFGDIPGIIGGANLRVTVTITDDDGCSGTEHYHDSDPAASEPYCHSNDHMDPLLRLCDADTAQSWREHSGGGHIDRVTAACPAPTTTASLTGPAGLRLSLEISVAGASTADSREFRVYTTNNGCNPADPASGGTCAVPGTHYHAALKQADCSTDVTTLTFTSSAAQTVYLCTLIDAGHGREDRLLDVVVQDTHVLRGHIHSTHPAVIEPPLRGTQ